MYFASSVPVVAEIVCTALAGIFLTNRARRLSDFYRRQEKISRQREYGKHRRCQD